MHIMNLSDVKKIDSIDKDGVNQKKKQHAHHESCKHKRKLDSMNKDEINQHKRQQDGNEATGN